MSTAAATFAASEDAGLNQYWYSPHTIQTLVAELTMHATACAFLSTPSLYFSLPEGSALRRASKNFEFDRRFAASDPDGGFVFYDFNKPDAVPVQCWDAFDYVVVDPPFITREVWAQYARTVQLLLKKGGKVLFTSVVENHRMLEEVMDAGENAFPLFVPTFRPSIPHLTYQYHCFVNYAGSGLERCANPELPAEDAATANARTLANDWRESQEAFAAQMRSRDRANEKEIHSTGRGGDREAIPFAAPPPTRTADGTAVDAAADARSGSGSAAIATRYSDGSSFYTPAAADTTGAIKWTRIPEGLTEFADGAEAPSAAEAAALAADPGPEYRRLERHRATLETFKKGIDAAIKDAEAVIRFSAKLAATAGDAAKTATATAAIDEAQAHRSATTKEMRVLLAAVAEGSPTDKANLCRVMEECLVALENPPTTAEKLRELSADCTRQYKSHIFNRQRELLAEMKKAKAAFIATSGKAGADGDVAGAAVAATA